MEKDLAQIPLAIHEYNMARMERIIKKLVVALVITIILIFASNCVWLYAWMQYDYSSDATTTETVTIDGKDGVANYIGNDGDITNGTDKSSKSDNKDTKTSEKNGK